MSPATRRRVLFALALAAFLVVFLVGWRGLPSLEPAWGWLAVSLALVPAVMLLNAVEYQVAARLLAHRVPFGEAMRISILGSAANLFPVPGAALVRTGALRRRGASLGGSAMATGALGAGWLGAAALVAGLLLLAQAAVPAGVAFTAGGAGAVTAMLVLARRAGGTWRHGAAIVLLEVVFVLLSALRTWATLTALGSDASLAQAAALTVAAPLAAAAGFLPGGLGLREALAGALSPLVGLAPAVGVVAASIDRMLGLVALAGGAALLLALTRSAE